MVGGGQILVAYTPETGAEYRAKNREIKSRNRSKVSFFCQKMRKNRKIVQILTSTKKHIWRDLNPSNPHKSLIFRLFAKNFVLN